jgi:hypothetical protein
MERDQANTAKMEAEQAAMDAMTAQTAAEDKAKMYKAELDKLRGEVDTGEMTMASEAAEALFKVLVDPADGSTLTAPMVSVDIEDGTLKAMAADYKMADAAPDMIEGWMGAMLVHADGHVAVVYSDRGTDGGKPLYDLYTFTAPADGKPRSYGVSNTDSTTQIDWDDVKRPDSTTTGGEEPGSSMFTGSVRGVPGSFSCPEDCDAPARHSDGTVNVPDNAGAWMFVPNDANAVIAGADSAYLTFGWWLQKDAGGMASAYRPIMSAPGMVAANAGDTSGSEIVGTATYTGGAAGKYALPSTEADTYEGGHFTAMATITADFDADNDADVAGNDRNGIKLSGMIDNFMTGDVSRDWTVKLMADGDTTADAMGAQPVDDLAADLDAASLTAEWSMGDSAATTMGTWDPTFYHEGTAPTDDMAPDAVTGTFEAGGNIGRLRGAFGANKVME